MTLPVKKWIAVRGVLAALSSCLAFGATPASADPVSAETVGFATGSSSEANDDGPAGTGPATVSGESDDSGEVQSTAAGSADPPTPGIASVPEPGTLSMTAAGALLLGWMVRRRARR